MIRIKNQDGNWVEGCAVNGQEYQLVINGDIVLQSYWNDETITQHTKITQLAFLNRFTDDEAVDIDLASIGATRGAALLRRYLQKVNAATFIDLSRQDLAEDLNKLVEYGLLTQERVSTILTAPIQSHEIFKG